MKKIMFVLILAILILFIGGCGKTTPTITRTQELVLNEQDLQQLGMMSDGTDCFTDDEYTNIIDSSIGQYASCSYNINSLNDTGVVIELQKFANYEALDGSYQYSSSHLFSIEGLISENEYGDKSRFRVNNVNDYGGQYNDPNVYYYHLWICKDLFLIHITSSGRSKEADEYVIRIGQRILSKFG